MTNIREYIMSLGSPQRGGKRPGVTNAHVLGAILVTSALLFAAFAMTSVSFSDTEQNEDVCLSASVGYTFWSSNSGTNLEYIVTAYAALSVAEVGVKAVGSPVAANVVIPNTVFDDGVTYTVRSIGSGSYPGGVFTAASATITSVTIPNSVKTIGDYAFYDCENLTGTLVIPDSVETIGSSAFGNTDLTSVIIGNSVKTIGGYAFGGCPNLTSVTIPNSVETIGDEAFYSSSILHAVAVPNGVSLGILALPSSAKIVRYSMSGTGSVTATCPSAGNIALVIDKTPAATNIAVGTTPGGSTVTPTGSGNNWSFAAPSSTYYVTVDPLTYSLTVIGGTGATGTGTYTAGAAVTISAGTAPAGKQFNGWTTSGGGSFANAGNASTTFTMPASAVTVTANFVDIPPATYIVFMTGGSATPGSGVTGSTVTLTPGTAPSGHQFKQWNVTSAGGGSLSGNTFTIGTSNAAIEAVWEVIPEPSSSGSGDNGGNGGGTSPVVVAVIAIAIIGGVGAAVWFFFFKP